MTFSSTQQHPFGEESLDGPLPVPMMPYSFKLFFYLLSEYNTELANLSLVKALHLLFAAIRYFIIRFPRELCFLLWVWLRLCGLRGECCLPFVSGRLFHALLFCCCYFYDCLFIFSNQPPRNVCQTGVFSPGNCRFETQQISG